MSDGSADARLQRMVQAALNCFIRYGYRRTSMETIARAAGMSRPALYQHFSGKEDMFRASVAHLLDASVTEAAARGRADGSLEERLYGVLATKIDLVVGQLDAELRGELLHEAEALAQDLLDAHRERLLQILTAILDDVASELPCLQGELTARQAAELLFYAATGIKYEHTTAETAHATLRRAVMLIVRGLRAP